MDLVRKSDSRDLKMIWPSNISGSCKKNASAFGLTSLHDCGISEHTLSLLEKSQKQKVLKMNVFALLSDNPDYYEKWT